MVLRNVVPRQGTETESTNDSYTSEEKIEKCSSPTGDGNASCFCLGALLSIEKCSSPTGDGNMPISSSKHPLICIEKCSSPTGDGNAKNMCKELPELIEKCSSPTGDGNLIRSSASVLVFPD